MSTISLEILNAEKYREEFEDNIIYNYENYIMRKRFRVGEGIKDQDELKHSLLFYRALCTDNCDLVDYISDKINGFLEKKAGKRKQKINEIITTAEQEVCSPQYKVDAFITDCCAWDAVEW